MLDGMRFRSGVHKDAMPAPGTITAWIRHRDKLTGVVLTFRARCVGSASFQPHELTHETPTI